MIITFSQFFKNFKINIDKQRIGGTQNKVSSKGIQLPPNVLIYI